MNLNNLLKELKTVIEEAPLSFKEKKSKAILSTSGDGRAFINDSISKADKLVENRDKEGLEKLANELRNIIK